MKVNNPEIEKYRVRHGKMASDESYGNNGCFRVTLGSQGAFIIASDGEGWEHVSVSMRNRPPTWEEMCWVKDLFWGEDETVVQYHPAKADYVNNHPRCLHLWKPIDQELPKPPALLVGLKGIEVR